MGREFSPSSEHNGLNRRYHGWSVRNMTFSKSLFCWNTCRIVLKSCGAALTLTFVNKGEDEVGVLTIKDVFVDSDCESDSGNALGYISA
ncbi:hypothetical protein LOAG_05155 [Loa loa]|uniref:Uncharacterized protein n=1 Tax=Loa loa TaxID=7209 RepID=A0A1S0U296_LOALO|nr:hypothetical protein LOAG_05155 [Loa loa]EFO23331.1 hypothetical protein LOAG_05155 [Loa loa]